MLYLVDGKKFVSVGPQQHVETAAQSVSAPF